MRLSDVGEDLGLCEAEPGEGQERGVNRRKRGNFGGISAGAETEVGPVLADVGHCSTLLAVKDGVWFEAESAPDNGAKVRVDLVGAIHGVGRERPPVEARGVIHDAVLVRVWGGVCGSVTEGVRDVAAPCALKEGGAQLLAVEL